MASSDGRHYPALDHVRAVAAFLVFGWHFIHVRNGQLAGPAGWGLSFITEGHTGVALFMALSGYLFAKLLDGRQPHLLPFFRNRALRLFPLLVLVFAIAGVLHVWRGGHAGEFALALAKGFVLPTWPNGGWSIAVEWHFYLLLPTLLWCSRASPKPLLAVLAAAFLLRLAWWFVFGQVHEAAYATLLGRIDQFVLGMLAWQWRSVWPLRGIWLAVGAVTFAFAFHMFDAIGGFYGQGGYPSSSPVWLVLCTAEGLIYASLIAWYDQLWGTLPAAAANHRASRALARVGQWAYAIYLLHFFVVFDLARWIDVQVWPLDTPVKAAVAALPAFLLVLPFAALAHRWIELPAMHLRRRY